MRGFATAAFLLAALAAPSFAKVEVNRNTVNDYQKYVPNRVIVELESTSVLGARDVGDAHAHFFEELDRRAPGFKVGRKFNSPVFTGASIQVENLEDIKHIAAISGVKSVHRIPIIPSPKITVTEAPKLGFDPGQYPPIVQTGVDKVHATGNKGKGIKVGIIDSGIDYNHPALGGGFGPGFKVAGGWDFVGDDYFGGGIPVEDPDPHDNCGGHGTHVAGIIAADPNNPYNITGVAPEATLRSYRIFGCAGGGTSDENIVAALLRAHEEKNDVINLSLGGLDGWTTGASSVIASRLAKLGHVLTISAGNSGTAGAFFSSGPANGIDVISVGSVDSIGFGPLHQVTTTLSGLGPFPYQWDGSLNPLPVGDVALPVYATAADLSVADDACNPLPESTPDLSGYVTLIRRGTCNFTIKVANAVAKGAKVILLFNNGGNFGPINTGGYEFAAIVDTPSGVALFNAAKAGSQFTISFPQNGPTTSIPNVATPGLTSSFSSYGPTYDMFFKPAVSGPGGQILSTYPLDLSGYAIASGTSMSAPHLAGVSALVLKAKGVKFGPKVRDLLQTTSTVIPSSLVEGSLPQTLAVAGAGTVNAYNALTYSTVVTPGQFTLNDTANWQKTQTFWIQNTGKKVKTYTIKHVPAGTAVSLVPGTIQFDNGPVALDPAAVSVSFSATKVSVLPGIALPVVAKFTPPTGLDTKTLPVVSGHVQVESEGEILKVSYLGLATSARSAKVIDNTADILGIPVPLVLDTVGNIVEESADFTWIGESYPLLIFRTTFGTRRVTFDLVPANTTIKPNAKRDLKHFLEGLIGHWFPNTGHSSGTYAKVPILGQLGEWTYYPRNDDAEYPYWDYSVPNTFANGTQFGYGSYRLLLRALKVTGNPTKQEDYETWLSPILNYVAA